MPYTFYPRKDNPCPNVGHCPHAGGAAIASLVLQSNDHEEFHRYLHGKIDRLQEDNSKLLQENKKLSQELEQVKLELKHERQNKFATNKQKQAEAESETTPQSPAMPTKPTGRSMETERIFGFTPMRPMCMFSSIRLGRVKSHATYWGRILPGLWSSIVTAATPPTNNLAERALRPLVVLRKITFGHRSEAGAYRMAQLMSVAETARRHGHRPSDIYFDLLTRPPDAVLTRLDAGPLAKVRGRIDAAAIIEGLVRKDRSPNAA